MKQKEISDLGLCILSVIGVVTLLFYINYFGAPWTDESFPLATSLRFLHGQKPFVDDMSPYMFIGILLCPLTKLITFIHQGKNELVLSFRHSYLIFSFLISSYIFFFLRNNLPQILAFFIVLMMVIFHPFGINNFHYDTLAVLLWSAILFQLYSFQFIAKIKKTDLIIFSLFHVGLCFSYPTFSFFFLVFYAIYFSFLTHGKLILISHVVIGIVCCICISWLLIFYFKIQWNDIKKSLIFSQNLFHLSDAHQGIVYKTITVIKQLTAQYKLDLGVALLLLAGTYFLRHYKFIVAASLFILIFLPLHNFPLEQIRYTEIFYCLVFWGLLNIPIFLLFLRDDPQAKKLMFFIALPALSAGLLTSITSYNKSLNFILGFFPASLLMYAYFYFILEKKFANSRFFYPVTRGILMTGILLMSFFQWNYIYSIVTTGNDLYKNTVHIKQKGPFYNLHIEPYSEQLLKELQNDINLIDTKNTDYFVYFGIFSAGYLFVNYLNPGDYLLYAPYKLAHFGAELRTPSYVFDFSKLFHFDAKDIMAYLKESSYRKVNSKTYYDVYIAKY